MRKVFNIGIMLCMLASAVFFWLMAGTQFMQLITGPHPLGDREGFSQAEGKYISYEAAYPMASCVEEYYSGDPSRVRLMGYVVYDEERQAFLYVIMNENDDGRIHNLLSYLGSAVQVRQSKDMTPAVVWGTLEPMEEAAVSKAMKALEDSDVADLFYHYDGTSSYETYFGDEYGAVTTVASQKILEGWEQADWYYIKDNTIGGVAISGIWFCILTVGFSLLIFLISLISLLKGGKKGRSEATSSSGSKWEHFLEVQRVWIEDWCEYSKNRTNRTACLTVLGCAAGLALLGVLVKAPVNTVLTWYLPMGMVFGEVIVIILWLAQSGRENPDKILKKIKKNIEQEFPSPEVREFYAGDFLEAGEEWTFREREKDAMLCGAIGRRYWTAFSGLGTVTIVDSERLRKIETVTISGSVRSGRVRVKYRSYGIRFYYRDGIRQDRCDRWLSFNWVDTAGIYMNMVRKRVGDSIEIVAL